MTATLQIRIDSELRQAADSVFADIGMDTNSAIRLFLRQAVIRRSFPFEVIGSDPFFHPANQEDGGRNYHAHDLIDADEGKPSKSRKTKRRAVRAKDLA